jgi:hypothetical protein
MAVENGLDLDRLPVVVADDGVVIRATEAGELTISLVRLAKGHDARPLFQGLPDNLCQCPHWGYVIKGSLRVWTTDGASEVVAGQAFYWPPGHAPEALDDAEFLEISPTRELQVLYEHLAAPGEGSRRSVLWDIHERGAGEGYRTLES